MVVRRVAVHMADLHALQVWQVVASSGMAGKPSTLASVGIEGLLSRVAQRANSSSPASSRSRHAWFRHAPRLSASGARDVQHVWRAHHNLPVVPTALTAGNRGSIASVLAGAGRMCHGRTQGITGEPVIGSVRPSTQVATNGRCAATRVGHGQTPRDHGIEATAVALVASWDCRDYVPN